MSYVCKMTIRMSPFSLYPQIPKARHRVCRAFHIFLSIDMRLSDFSKQKCHIHGQGQQLILPSEVVITQFKGTCDMILFRML